MRKFLSSVIFLTLILNGCRSVKSGTETMPSPGQVNERTASTNFSEPETWLLGYINRVQFSNAPHSEWFLKGYEAYQPDQAVSAKLIQVNKDSLSIKIVLGTWCPDSRRELPRFMRILDIWQFPAESVTFIGVDNSKLAPIGDYDKLEIERVPTFIFLRNKVEAGRIIENPSTSLEQDMLNILTRNENNENQ